MYMPFQKGHKINIGNKYNLNKKLTKEWKEKISLAHKGKKLSEITKKKISEANKKRIFTEKWKQNISEGLKGRVVSKETKEKHSKNIKKLVEKGILHQKGEKASNWQGGKTELSFLIRSLPEYSIWRIDIFRRDDFTCKKCGRKRKKGDRVIIQADHIYPLSKIIKDEKLETICQALSCKKLWDLDNGRTLCIECHKKTDTWGINQFTKL